MINKFCKLMICLGGLLLVTSCNSHRTVYVSQVHLDAAPESVVVVPDVLVLENGQEYFLYERRLRRPTPFYFSNEFHRSRFYAPGYYRPMYAHPRSHVEFQFGLGFSRRFR